MLAFRHNRECDSKLWFGEIALNGFESVHGIGVLFRRVISVVRQDVRALFFSDDCDKRHGIFLKPPFLGNREALFVLHDVYSAGRRRRKQLGLPVRVGHGPASACRKACDIDSFSVHGHLGHSHVIQLFYGLRSSVLRHNENYLFFGREIVEAVDLSLIDRQRAALRTGTAALRSSAKGIPSKSATTG